MRTPGLSPLAQYAPKLKELEPRPGKVHGVCVHTSGSGIVARAEKHGRDPLDEAVSYYYEPDAYSAHYVIGYNGTIVQITNELQKCSHVGWSAVEREWCLSGRWKMHLPDKTVELWQRAWPSYSSPATLYPGPSPNAVYIGVELIPRIGTVSTVLGRPFTDQQYKSLKDLVIDIGVRWNFPAGWSRSGRLCGHEDLAPFNRHDRSGQGWDPGSLRDHPRFLWDRVR